LDTAGGEIVRHGPSGFLGEVNLLSGQTVFVTAMVTKDARYIAVDRDALRELLYEDGPLSDLVLATFIGRREALQRVQGIGLEIIGPHSSHGDDADRRTRAQQPPAVHVARFRRADDREAAALVAGFDAASLLWCGCPAVWSCAGPRTASLRALGIGRELARREDVDLLVVAADPPGSAPRSTVPLRGSTRS